MNTKVLKVMKCSYLYPLQVYVPKTYEDGLSYNWSNTTHTTCIIKDRTENQNDEK